MLGWLHRFTVETHVLAAFGAVVFSDPAKLRITAAVGSERLDGVEKRTFDAYAHLAPTEAAGGSQGVPEYSTAAAQVLTLPARPLAALDSVALARVYAQAPTGTTVRLRARNLAGVYFWNGTAWVAASGSNWNTAAETETGLLQWPHKALGFDVQLATTSKYATPRFYGVMAACEFRFERTSVNVDIPSSSRDDLLTRTVARALSEEPDYEAAEEFDAAAALTVIEYGEAHSDMDRTWDVAQVLAVYDVTDDPDREEALEGTWDAEAKTYTLDAPIPEGHRVHSRLRLRIPCAYSGDADWYTTTLPYIHLTAESFVDRDLMRAQALLASDLSEVWRVPGAREVTATLKARVVAEDPVEAQEIAAAIQQWFERGGQRGGYGRTVLSAATGLPAYIHFMGEQSPLEKRGDAHEIALRLVVERWAEIHPAGVEPALQTVDVR